MVPALILLLIIFSFLLIKSADSVIIAIRRLSRETKAGVFALSALILALGTSFPELFVSVASAIEKTPNLSLGIVIGSNIANISLVAGLATLVIGKVNVHGNYLKRDVLVALAAGILPVILALDKELGRVDGLVLLLVYAAYASSFFRKRFLEIAEEQKKEGFFYRFLRRFNHIDSIKTKELGRLFIGLALLLASSDIIVKISLKLTSFVSIPIFVVGLIVLAVGTSLPELAFSLRSLEGHEPSMFFGNLLGSTIANSTLVIGLAAVIFPIKIVAMDNYIISAMAFMVIFGSFWYFIRTKRRLDRWEAAFLLSLYLIFFVAEFAL